MSKIPSISAISGKKAIKVFEKIGYATISKKGSHFRLSHDGKEFLTIPDHKTLGKGLLRRILRDADVSVKEFIKLL